MNNVQFCLINQWTQRQQKIRFELWFRFFRSTRIVSYEVNQLRRGYVCSKFDSIFLPKRVENVSGVEKWFFLSFSLCCCCFCFFSRENMPFVVVAPFRFLRKISYFLVSVPFRTKYRFISFESWNLSVELLSFQSNPASCGFVKFPSISFG